MKSTVTIYLNLCSYLPCKRIINLSQAMNKAVYHKASKYKRILPFTTVSHLFDNSFNLLS